MTYMHSPMSRSGKAEEDGPALWLDDGDWSEAAIPPREWLVPGIALRGAVTVITGAPGAGKSLLAGGMMVSTSLCKPLGQIVPKQACRVLALNFEDDAEEQRRRLSAACRQFGASPADLKGRVIRAGTNGLGTLLEMRPGSAGSLTDTPLMGELEAQIAALRPDLAFIDPLVEAHGADENNNTAVRAVVARFRTLAVKYNLGVVLVHHTRKGSAANPGDPDTARGGSAIVGAARVVLTVCTMSEADAEALGVKPEARRFYLRLDHAKTNYTASAAAKWFEKTVYILDNGEAVPATVPWSPPQHAVTEAMLDEIAAAVRQGTPEGPYSKRLSIDESRSIRPVLERVGITTTEGQKKALAELFRRRFIERDYKSPGNRGWRKGLRSPDGLPVAEWAPEKPVR